MEYVKLDFANGAGWVCLCELTGFVEQAVQGTGVFNAIRLLDGLLQDVPNQSVGPGEAASLTAPDRDKLLATVYQNTYGSEVASSVQCAQCQLPFDLDFSLQELAASQLPKNSDTDKLYGWQKNGALRLENGISFRLPTGNDELAVMNLSLQEAEKELLSRCLIDSEKVDRDFSEPQLNELSIQVQSVMEMCAPVMDVSLKAECPGCGFQQLVHFDIQHFLLTVIMQERARLTEEIHYLAKVYGWSFNEILSLPRSQRRLFAHMIEAEMSDRRGVTLA